jgi:hypothetical protein
MKVGLSLSRCMRDILEEKVDIYDVLVVVARTDVDPYNDAHWKAIWDGYLYGGYSNPEWAGLEDYEQAMRDILISLYESGKLHQPRQFGAHPTRLPYYWLDTFAPEEEIAKNPAAQKAWDNYKLIAGLS